MFWYNLYPNALLLLICVYWLILVKLYVYDVS